MEDWQGLVVGVVVLYLLYIAYMASQNQVAYECKKRDPLAVAGQMCQGLPDNYPLFTPWDYKKGGELKGQFNCDDACAFYLVKPTGETKIIEVSGADKWVDLSIPEFNIGDKLKITATNTGGPAGVVGEFTWMGRKYITNTSTFKTSEGTSTYEPDGDIFQDPKQNGGWKQIIKDNNLRYIWPYADGGYDRNNKWSLKTESNKVGSMYFTGV